MISSRSDLIRSDHGRVRIAKGTYPAVIRMLTATQILTPMPGRFPRRLHVSTCACACFLRGCVGACWGACVRVFFACMCTHAQAHEGCKHSEQCARIHCITHADMHRMCGYNRWLPPPPPRHARTHARTHAIHARTHARMHASYSDTRVSEVLAHGPMEGCMAQ